VRARLLLASSSPRRRELLTQAGIDFEVVSPDTTESESTALSIRELTTLNATRKALDVAYREPDAVVLAADTLVALDGGVIGKPADLDQATAILRRLAGREHQVCTSVFLCRAATRQTKSFYVISDVQFHALRDSESASYLNKINPLDKAGAYAAQGHGRDIIQRIRGSYTNVVGLPVDETLAALRSFGITPRQEAGASR
jgi:septum formation protein